MLIDKLINLNPNIFYKLFSENALQLELNGPRITIEMDYKELVDYCCGQLKRHPKFEHKNDEIFNEINKCDYSARPL